MTDSPTPDADPSATPRFGSAVASPEELMARVAEVLERSGSLGPSERTDAEVDLEGGQALGGGWFAFEPLGNVHTRFTGRRFDFEATIDRASHLLIEACLLPESGLAQLRARLRVDDAPGGSARFRPGWNFAFFALPPGLSGRARFFLDAGGSWCPAASGRSADHRDLALAVRRIAFIDVTGDLPRLAGASLAEVCDLSPIASHREQPLYRLVRRVRRFLLGWEVSDRLRRLDGVLAALGAAEARFQTHERLFNEAMDRLKERLAALGQGAAETPEDLARAVSERERALERKLQNLPGE